ncbi:MULTISPECIES: M20 aminoacylase family protein [Methylomonas]|uniref:Amidohydrolase n=2 Tax=Methylomonas TaxID=416 RepID=A0A126T8G7_9GAMM|nr:MULTISPECIES: M20 aminoacylase family protein [Methylomonas]AMK78389.1 amidohydrolase [Methylomonas denitrificans]OAI04095.1 amidohydrolase [Methylomonas methanica]TCV87581.1 hippurate hydrolase [Methylomonas methanica]
MNKFDAESSPADLIPEIVANIAGIRDLRRDIHAHPELCFEEVRTAELVAAKLTEWGIPVHRGLGKTGVIGIVKAGSSDSAIGLRADMDALPMHEQNSFAHASRHPGKMHGCGHDGHTAMLLAAAEYLATQRNFDGTVYLIFQPAEEGGGGADEMIKDGLFELFPMQVVYGMHNWPELPAGQFAVSPGPVMASLNTFRIVVRGKGCHAALPHLGLDPVPVAAQMIMAFQTILTRNANPLDNGLISVTMLHAGEATNIIADTCELAGTVRTFSNQLLDLIETRMREIARHICLAHGMECDFDFKRSYPPTVNHDQAVAVSRSVMTRIVGERQVLEQKATMGAEDFAYMLQKLPGSYCFIGNGSGDHRGKGHGAGPCTLHNTSYDFNDDILPLGATYWVRLVEACLPVS